GVHEQERTINRRAVILDGLKQSVSAAVGLSVLGVAGAAIGNETIKAREGIPTKYATFHRYFIFKEGDNFDATKLPRHLDVYFEDTHLQNGLTSQYSTSKKILNNLYIAQGSTDKSLSHLVDDQTTIMVGNP